MSGSPSSSWLIAPAAEAVSSSGRVCRIPYNSCISNIGQRISIIQSITLDGDRCSRSTVQICHKDSIVPGPVSSIGKGACDMGIAQKLLEYMRSRLRARQQRSAKSSAQFEYFRRSNAFSYLASWLATGFSCWLRVVSTRIRCVLQLSGQNLVSSGIRHGHASSRT